MIYFITEMFYKPRKFSHKCKDCGCYIINPTWFRCESCDKKHGTRYKHIDKECIWCGKNIIDPSKKKIYCSELCEKKFRPIRPHKWFKKKKNVVV